MTSTANIVYYPSVNLSKEMKASEPLKPSKSITLTPTHERVPFSMSIISSMSYTSHAAINVSTDAELAAIAVNGSGSYSDPYVLEGWNITTSGIHGIFIRNTTVHFLIRNCWITTGTVSWTHGIYVTSVTTGTVTIVDNTLHNNFNGIYLENSGNVTVANNTCTQNRNYGIFLQSSGNSTVANNTCTQNDKDGIKIKLSGDSIVLYNICKENIENGIFLDNSGHSMISNNTCNQNYDSGIKFLSSGNSTAAYNICTYNYRGIHISLSDYATVVNNICNQNNWKGILLENSDYSTVINSTCSQNGEDGIKSISKSCLIKWNFLADNQNYGVYLTFLSENNQIHHNIFFNNNKGAIQAYDLGINNQWYEVTTNGGNLWSDYTGIGVYQIDGSDAATDPHPLNSVDTDGDHLPDIYETIVGLNLHFDDSTEDLDEDGLSNLEEYQLGTKANDPDSDMDGLSDGDDDEDNDGMDNRYEFQMELKPRFNDAAEDLDDDGLTNLQEFRYGTWANQSDTDLDRMPDWWEIQMSLDPTQDDAMDDADEDRMPNLWEFQMGLDARTNDAEDDLDDDDLTNLQEFQYHTLANHSDTDQDGMSDGWEYAYDFNMTDPVDATKDPDGDWITNVNEFKGGSDPRNFWSVPLISLSVLHVSIIIMIIFLSMVGGVTYMRRKTKQRLKLITQFKAPDYPTALKILKGGFPDYPAFQQAEIDAKAKLERGKSLYLKGNYLTALQQYEQALELFKRLGNKLLIAETIFRDVWIQAKSLGTLRINILDLFPSPPYKDPQIDALRQMVEALRAEERENWGAAEEAWNAALNCENLDISYQLICKGALTEAKVRRWLNDPIESTQDKLISQVNDWQKECETEQYIEGLCQVYLLRVRIALATFQFEEVEKWLECCVKTAEDAGLGLYQELAQKEKKIFSQHKQRIVALIETETPQTPKEQAKKMHEYVKEALLSLEKAGLRK